MEAARLATGLLAFTLLGLVNAEVGFFGNGVETVYKYFADVRAGSVIPEEYASQFGIRSNLRVQSVEANKAIFQFQDVHYQLSTGHLGTHEFSKAKFVPVPQQSEALNHPFEVIYEGGKVKSVLTMDEPEWSQNIKKAVAAIFQLDIPHFHYEKPNTFVSEEKTLYGTCTVGYTVMPKGSGLVEVVKSQENNKCNNFPSRYYTNGVYDECPFDHHENTLLMGSNRDYKVFIGEGGMKVKEIISWSIAAAVPFNGASDDQTVFVRQNFTYVSSKPIEEAISFAPAHEYQELTYAIPHFYSEVGSFADLTGGREMNIKDKHMSEVHKILADLVHFMDEMKVSNHPEKINNDLTQQLTYHMGQLDTECLSHCFERYMKPKTYFEENLRGAFLEVAAQVGSKATLMFLRDLIVSHKLPDALAAETLRLIPFYVREPSFELVKELESLLNVEMNDKVKKSAILSVSNLAFFAFKKFHDVDMLNHFVDMFYESFKASTNYGMKLNYLTAISNMEGGKVLDYMMEVVEDHHYSHHLRYVALWGTHAPGIKFPTKVYQLYWPIFTDHKETIDMRAAALKLLMITEPTFDRFLSIFWYMQSEQSSQLYYYFYTGVDSLSHSEHPCFKSLGHHAGRLLRYAKAPHTTYTFTGDYYMDYVDPQHSLGGNSHFSWIGDADTGAPNVFYYSQGGYYSGYNHEYFSVMVRITGMAESLRTQLLKADRESVKMGDLLKVLASLHIKPMHRDPFNVEIILYTSHRAVETFYYDESNFMKLVDDIKVIGSSLQRDFKLRQHNIIYSGVHEYVQPTDIGVPAVWNLATPYAMSVVGNFTHDATGPRIARKNSMEIRYSRQGGHSLSFYNPFAGVWHGACRTLLHMYTIPIRNHMSLDFTQKHFKFAMARDEAEDLHLGLVYHVRSQVYATDYDHDAGLRESCPECLSFVTVKKAGHEHRDFNVFTYDSEETGMVYKFDVFDCDQYEKPYEIIPLVEEFFNDEHMNADYGDLLAEFYLALRKMHTKLGFSPKVGSCGMAIQVIPSTKHHATQLEGLMHLTTEKVKENQMVSPSSGEKHTLRGSLTFKGSDQQVYHTFDVMTFMENSADDINEHFSFKLTHSAPKEKDFKVCLDMQSKYPEKPSDFLAQRKTHEEEVTSRMTMMWGVSTDGKCPTGSGFKLKMMSHPAEVDHEHDLPYPYSECAKDAQKPEWKEKPFTPVTDACLQAAMESTLLRNFTGYVRYYDIPEELIEIASMVYESLEDVVEVKEIPGEDRTSAIVVSTAAEREAGSGKSGVMKYAVEIEKDSPHANFHFGWEGEEDEEHYLVDFEEDVAMTSSRFSFLKTIGYEMGFLSSCVVTPSTVLTLDNDTFHYESSHCYTLATADCSEQPKFAVFTKTVEGPYDQAVKFYAGGNYLEIMPDAEGHFHVNVNGAEVSGGLHDGYQYPEGDEFYDFKLWHKDGFVTLYSQLSKVTVGYNGHSTKVTVPGMYRGYSCGVCGDYDSDSTFTERQEVMNECHDDARVGTYLGYRYTMINEKCPEITEDMTKKVKCNVDH